MKFPGLACVAALLCAPSTMAAPLTIPFQLITGGVNTYPAWSPDMQHLLSPHAG
jgi:hypothetical protein